VTDVEGTEICRRLHDRTTVGIISIKDGAEIGVAGVKDGDKAVARLVAIR
jgi:hypothetical protein